MYRFIILYLAVIVYLSHASVLPQGMLTGQCRRNDPNLNQCLLRRATELLPHFCNGIPSAGIPSFDPLNIDSFEHSGNEPNVQIEAKMTGLTLLGHRNAQFSRVEFDPRTLAGVVVFLTPEMQMRAKMITKGNILAFPFENRATYNWQFTGVNMAIKFQLKSVLNNGIEYYSLETLDLHTYSQNGHMQLESEDPSNQIIDDLTAAAFNANPRLIMDTLNPFMSKSTAAIYKNVFGYVLQKIPADELLPKGSP